MSDTHAIFNFHCSHYIECMTEYSKNVDKLLNQLGEMHGVGEYGMFTSYIPQHHWSATIIHAYAAFEQKLNEACQITASTRSLGLHFKNFAGQGVSRARLYLESYAQLHLNVRSDQWQHVDALGKLRNTLVHGGFSKEHANFKFLSAYAKRTRALSVSDDELQIGSRTVTFALEKLGGPLQAVGEAILGLQNEKSGETLMIQPQS